MLLQNLRDSARRRERRPTAPFGQPPRCGSKASNGSKASGCSEVSGGSEVSDGSEVSGESAVRP
jgi:hypothetical protein